MYCICARAKGSNRRRKCFAPLGVIYSLWHQPYLRCLLGPVAQPPAGSRPGQSDPHGGGWCNRFGHRSAWSWEALPAEQRPAGSPGREHAPHWHPHPSWGTASQKFSTLFLSTGRNSLAMFFLFSRWYSRNTCIRVVVDYADSWHCPFKQAVILFRAVNFGQNLAKCQDWKHPLSILKQCYSIYSIIDYSL